MEWFLKFLIGVVIGMVFVAACVLMFLIGKNMFIIIDAIRGVV